MTNLETSAINSDASCEELKEALARQHELLLLRQQVEAHGALVGGATMGGELLPESTNECPNNTVIESEIERINQLLVEKGCE